MVVVAPAGPYHRFVKDVFQSTAEEFPPGSRFTTVMTKVCSKWSTLPSEEKLKYKEAYTAERAQRIANKLVSGCVACLMARLGTCMLYDLAYGVGFTESDSSARHQSTESCLGLL